MKFFVTGIGLNEGVRIVRGIIGAKIDSTLVANVWDLHTTTCRFLAKKRVAWSPYPSMKQESKSAENGLKWHF